MHILKEIMFILLTVHLGKITCVSLLYSSSILLIQVVAAAAASKSLQSCPTLCDPIDGSPPGSSVPGILQARILEWVHISHESEK